MATSDASVPEPDESVLRIRRRVDGVLQEQVMDEKRIASAVVSRLKLMSGLDISEKRLPQDGRFSVRLGTRNIDVRISTNIGSPHPWQHRYRMLRELMPAAKSRS